MRTSLLSALFFLLLMPPAMADLHYPSLTGRVMDNAHVLSTSTIQDLDLTLGDYEERSSNQLVVISLPTLQGDTIEHYGYQLGRHWKLGQKGKNNGVLLIIAPTEHKVRIEVGYGLEPVLTDALSAEITDHIIVPQFKAGNMNVGVINGIDAIIRVLDGKSIAPETPPVNPQVTPPELTQPYPLQSKTPQPLSPQTLQQMADARYHPPPQPHLSVFHMLLLLVFIVWFFSFSMRHPFIAAWMISNASSRFGSSGIGSGWGDGGGGGFSGGGGSFGGGGASGSW